MSQLSKCIKISSQLNDWTADPATEWNFSRAIREDRFLRWWPSPINVSLSNDYSTKDIVASREFSNWFVLYKANVPKTKHCSVAVVSICFRAENSVVVDRFELLETLETRLRMREILSSGKTKDTCDSNTVVYVSCYKNGRIVPTGTVSELYF